MGREKELLSHLTEQMQTADGRPFRGTSLSFQTDFVINRVDVMIFGVTTTEFAELTPEAAANLRYADFALEHIGMLVQHAIGQLKTKKLIEDESVLEPDCLLLADSLRARFDGGTVDFLLSFHVKGGDDAGRQEMHTAYFHFPRDEKDIPQMQLAGMMTAAD